MKRIIVVGVMATAGLTQFTSCGGSTEQTEVSEIAYYCPMECEGSKTYAAEGSCPVCKMDLVKK